MKLTKLSAAPFRGRSAASCPRRRGAAGTASQLIASVGRTDKADAVPQMTPADFATKWPGPLSRMDPSLAATLAVSEASRQFLVEAGLPIDVGFDFIGFHLSGDTLSRLGALSSALPDPAWSRYVVLGADRFGTVRICLDEASRGRVLQVCGLGSDADCTFMNSSVEQHAAFWLTWRLICGSSANESPDLTGRLLKRAFSEIDPPAMAEETLPWVALAEEVELGVL
jgi:hypothetical protein